MRLVLFAGLAVVATAVQASITIQFTGVDLGGSASYFYNGNAKSSFAGRLNFANLTDSSSFKTYCVDLDNAISGGQTYDVNITNTLGDSTFEFAGSVFANSYASVTNSDEATALQLAIWAARYGTDNTLLSGGTFQLDSGWASSNATIVSLAQSYYNAGISSVSDALHYDPIPAGSGQGQLGPVPEPGSMLACGLALGALLKRRKKN